MTKWTGPKNDNPRYERIEVSELPTWTGKTGNKKETAKGPRSSVAVMARRI